MATTTEIERVAFGMLVFGYVLYTQRQIFRANEFVYSLLDNQLLVSVSAAYLLYKSLNDFWLAAFFTLLFVFIKEVMFNTKSRYCAFRPRSHDYTISQLDPDHAHGH